MMRYDPTNFFVLLLLNTIALTVLAPWLLIAIGAGMAFDSQGSERNVLPYLFAGPIFLYPVVVVVGILGGWVCFARRSIRAVQWAALPIGYIMLAGIYYLIFWVAHR